MVGGDEERGDLRHAEGSHRDQRREDLALYGRHHRLRCSARAAQSASMNHLAEASGSAMFRLPDHSGAEHWRLKRVLTDCDAPISQVPVILTDTARQQRDRKSHTFYPGP
eukprot:2993724-Pleurochrysis_carterae.AAC.4